MSTPTQPPSKKAEDLLRELESIRALLQSAKSKHSAPAPAPSQPAAQTAVTAEEPIDDDDIPVLGEDDEVPLLLNDEEENVPLQAAADTPPARHHLDDGMSLFDIANEGDDYPVFKTGAPQKTDVLNERVDLIQQDDYAPRLTIDHDMEFEAPFDIPENFPEPAPEITATPNPFLKRTEHQFDIEDITGSKTMTAATSLPGTNSEAMALFDKLRASSTGLQAVVAPAETKTTVSPDAVRTESNKLIEQIITETMPKLEAELRARLRAKFLK